MKEVTQEWALLVGAKWGLSAIVAYYVGLRESFQVLLALNVLDLATGLMVALSQKGVSSKIGASGIRKTAGAWIIIVAVHLVSEVAGNHFEMPMDLGGLVAWFYVLNEFISIVENCAKLGAPIPPIVLDTIKKAKMLQDKQEKAAAAAQEKQEAAVADAKIAVDSAKQAQKATDKLIEALPDPAKPADK